MARRRKIPAKKHRGVKDPEEQRRQREEKVKLKVNSAPKDLDDQEMPKKLQKLIQSKSDAKVVKKTTAKKSHLLDSAQHMGYEMTLPGMKRPLKPIPHFKQNPGESEKQFFNRINQVVEVRTTHHGYLFKSNHPAFSL